MSTIEYKDIGDTDELLKILPEIKNIRSQMTTSRGCYKYSSDNNNAANTQFPNNQTIKFTIPASKATLLNLAECYFDISGQMTAYTQANNSVAFDADWMDKFTTKKLRMKVGENWIWNSFQKINLYIGGALVYSVSTPMALSKFIKNHYQNDLDIKNDNEVIYGYHPSLARDPASPAPYPTVGKTALEDLSELTTFTSDYGYFTIADNKLDFMYQLRLIDILPMVETIKPIYGQDVVIEIITESAGYTNISFIAPNDLDGANDVAKQTTRDGMACKMNINQFKNFNLMAITYTVNQKMADKLSKFYSQPVIEIIDDIQYFNNSMQKLVSGNTLQFKCPLNLKFESDFISIHVPQATGNNSYLNEFISNANDLNLINHCVNDLRFINIQNIEIYADGELLYSRMYGSASIASANSSNVNIKLIGRSNGTQKDIYNYTDAYHLYKECRYCCGRTESGAVSFNDFLTTGFCIDVPTSAFTKLSTNSNIQVNITFGPGVESNMSGAMNQYSRSMNIQLNQIRVVQKSRKALVFKAFNSCEVKPIEFSFMNDVSLIEDKSDANAVQA